MCCKREGGEGVSQVATWSIEIRQRGAKTYVGLFLSSAEVSDDPREFLVELAGFRNDLVGLLDVHGRLGQLLLRRRRLRFGLGLADLGHEGGREVR